jgi:hypothetical protein
MHAWLNGQQLNILAICLHETPVVMTSQAFDPLDEVKVIVKKRKEQVLETRTSSHRLDLGSLP